MNLKKTTTSSRTTEPLPPYLLGNPLIPKNDSPPVETVKLTAKQKKKQEKKAARLAEEAAKLITKQQRKDSLDESCSVTTTSTATSKAQQPQQPKAKMSKKEAKKALAKAKNEMKVEEIVQMTKDIKLEEPRSKPIGKPKVDIETPKKEKRRVKANKIEYADPQYAKNKYDVLNVDDDEFESEIDDDDATESVSPTWRARSSTAESKHSKDSSFTTVQKTKAEKAKAQKLASQAWNREAKAALAAKAAAAAVPFIRPQSPYIRMPPTPQPIEIQLTKKQLKKMAQQQTRLAAQHAANATNSKLPTAANPNSNNQAQSMAQTLKNSMQRLSINDDTTIELVREQQRAAAVGASVPLNSSVSIIDQLSRGIQMEGLTLPPGITLTRVDPVQAEQIRAKKESIGRVSYRFDVIYT